MLDIVNSFIRPSNQTIIALVVGLCGIRVLLELTSLNPANWPISKKLSRIIGEAKVKRFHQMGLYICVAQIVLWAPELLFS